MSFRLICYRLPINEVQFSIVYTILFWHSGYIFVSLPVVTLRGQKCFLVTQRGSPASCLLMLNVYFNWLWPEYCTRQWMQGTGNIKINRYNSSSSIWVSSDNHYLQWSKMCIKRKCVLITIVNHTHAIQIGNIWEEFIDYRSCRRNRTYILDWPQSYGGIWQEQAWFMCIQGGIMPANRLSVIADQKWSYTSSEVSQNHN